MEAHKLARRTDPSTSKAAAAQVGQFAHRHHALVLGAVAQAGRPVGAEELADACGLDAYAVRKRLPELQEQGLVMLAPGTRRTRTGRSERLWTPATSLT